jgi:hypothetical protein
MLCWREPKVYDTKPAIPRSTKPGRRRYRLLPVLKF